MITNDTDNPGNYGMQFIPQWDTEVSINDVRIQIILPSGVTTSDVKTTRNLLQQHLHSGWATGGVLGKTYVATQRAVPSRRLFPLTVPSRLYSHPILGSGFDLASLAPLIVLPFIAIVVIALVVSAARKSSYASPKLSMETLGVKRGLTAVEASYLLDLKPAQIVTEILYSLLQRRAVWAEQTKPSLKLRVLPPFENKTGTPENPLRYYEIDFLNSLKADGTLDEEKLAHTIMFLRDTLEQKMEGYSRKDTVDYYQRIVGQAWTQVEQAGTPELTSNAYDEQLLWLLLDPNQRTRTQTVFHDRVFQPQPMWFWWWYGYTTYHSNPAYSPNINAPQQTVKPPAIPGADFANNIATAVEGTSNSIVVNLEKFANAIVPPPPKASHDPAHPKAGCVCACASCACACACVSCACACAGGGGH